MMVALQKIVAVFFIICGSIFFIMNSASFLESYIGMGKASLPSAYESERLNKENLEPLREKFYTVDRSKPKEGEIIGTLSIPKIEKSFPIYEGTSDKTLKKGVGHYSTSVLPGEKNNSVLSGHRDTVFHGLRKLEVHDKLVISTETTVYIYKIHRIRIVHKDDQTVLTPKPRAMLTLTTCYPFGFIGDAPDRYIISALLVSSNPK